MGIPARRRAFLPIAAALVAVLLLAMACGAGDPPRGLAINIGDTRSLTTPFVGANLDYFGVAQQYDSPAVMHSVEALSPGTLRYPGGTISNYWTWQTGSVNQPPTQTAKGTKGGIQRDYGFTLTTLASIVRATGTMPIFDLNVMTSTLPDQLQMLEAAQALGLPIHYVELGNEFYLSNSNYLRAFPTATSYADLVAQWAPAIHAQFPSALIAAVGSLPDRTARERTWNATVARIAGADVQAFTLHDYVGGNGAVRQGTVSAAGATKILAGIDTDWQAAESAMAALPARDQIWFTEYNLAKMKPQLSASWVHGLFVAGMTMDQLADPRAQLSDYWDLFNPSATGAYDVQGGSPVETGAGAVLSAMAGAVRDESTASSLTFTGGPDLSPGDPGLAGILLEGRGGRRALLLNLTGRAVTLRSATAATAGSSATTLHAAATAELSGTSGLSTTKVTVGSTLKLPADSLTVVG